MEFEELVFRELDSTQTYAEAHRADFAAAKLTAVCADAQTAGRGTRGRSWVAVPGTAVLMTFHFVFPAACAHESAAQDQKAHKVTRACRARTSRPSIKMRVSFLKESASSTLEIMRPIMAAR